MELFLLLNGFEIKAGVDDQEKVILTLAAGKLTLEELQTWLADRVIERSP